MFGGPAAPSPFAGATSSAPLFAGSAASSSQLFAGSGAPVFGGVATIGKPSTSSTSPGATSAGSIGGLFSKSPTGNQPPTTTVPETKSEEPGSSTESGKEFSKIIRSNLRLEANHS